ncbi:hypothetical protein FCH28_19390 [Streptomyces piniterrae]|uniref:Uncharacterized protein n=2 Tax=Streptomyces piniterrae TaxID=2571125 RepID=A0A4U0NEM5_9ACTN|nr:hypothetical protein FCH28_19390 [Streptomyces piniterrae]
MRARLLGMLRRQARDKGRGTGATPDVFEARVYAELAEELPDEDLGEDLADFLEHYEPGSRPGADEEEDEEFVETVRAALERIERR